MSGLLISGLFFAYRLIYVGTHYSNDGTSTIFLAINILHSSFPLYLHWFISRAESSRKHSACCKSSDLHFGQYYNGCLSPEITRFDWQIVVLPLEFGSFLFTGSTPWTLSYSNMLTSISSINEEAPLGDRLNSYEQQIFMTAHDTLGWGAQYISTWAIQELQTLWLHKINHQQKHYFYHLILSTLHIRTLFQ